MTGSMTRLKTDRHWKYCISKDDWKGESAQALFGCCHLNKEERCDKHILLEVTIGLEVMFLESLYTDGPRDLRTSDSAPGAPWCASQKGRKSLT